MELHLTLLSFIFIIHVFYENNIERDDHQHSTQHRTQMCKNSFTCQFCEWLIKTHKMKNVWQKKVSTLIRIECNKQLKNDLQSSCCLLNFHFQFTFYTTLTTHTKNCKIVLMILIEVIFIAILLYIVWCALLNSQLTI